MVGIIWFLNYIVKLFKKELRSYVKVVYFRDKSVLKLLWESKGYKILLIFNCDLLFLGLWIYFVNIRSNY